MSQQQYTCVPCHYNSSSKKDYNKHLLTRKHNILTGTDTKIPQQQTYTCQCGKIYKHRQSLHNHVIKCTYSASVDTYNVSKSNMVITDSSAIIELLRQNNEFKQLMVEQNNQMQETQTQLQQSYAQNTELQHQMVELFKEGKTITHNNHTSNKFNLNFFLNDTCKDAISITDFLRNMNVHIDELEYIGNHGYVNGMTKMIMDRLKDMDITKRPIHCTDIKRETMYIKDDSGWSKDTDELTKLRKILSRISMNNYRTVPDWRTAHPDCEVMESRSYDFCYKMMKAILGDVEDEQIMLDNKIIKTMAKELFVHK